MQHNIYTIYDSKSEAYTLPFFYAHDGQAIRTFRDWCNDKTNPYGKHPEDYTLFKNGVYEDDNATIEQNEIISLANGLQLVEQDK